MAVLAKSIAVMPERTGRRAGLFYLLPMVIAIVFMSFSLEKSQGHGAQVSGGLAFQHDPTRLIVLGGTYLLALGLCLRHYYWVRRRLIQSWPYLLLLGYIATSAFWSYFPLKVMVNMGHYVGFALVALAAVRYCQEAPEALIRAVAVSSAIAVGVSVVVSLAYPAIGISALQGRWQGITGNPNSLGLLCILAVWSGLGLLLNDRSRLLRLFGITVLGIGIVGLYGSRSTTSAIVSAWVMISLMASFLLRNHSGANRIVMALLLFLALVGMLVGTYIVVPELFSVGGALEAVGRDRHLTGRTELWEMAAKLIEQHPWRGWGFDSLASVLSRVHMIYGQFHNGYLDLAVRGGMVALLITGVMILQFYVRAIRLSKRDWTSASAAAVLVTGILVYNLAETSLVRTTHALWLMLLVLYFQVSAQSRIKRAVRPKPVTSADGLLHPWHDMKKG